MRIEDKTIIALFIIIILLVLNVGFMIKTNNNLQNKLDNVPYSIEETLVGYSVGISMYPLTINSTKRFFINTTSNDSIIIGRWYSYNKLNYSVSHQLIEIINTTKYSNCDGTLYLFKGTNNNFLDEVVCRNNITKQILGILWD